MANGKLWHERQAQYHRQSKYIHRHTIELVFGGEYSDAILVIEQKDQTGFAEYCHGCSGPWYDGSYILLLYD